MRDMSRCLRAHGFMLGVPIHWLQEAPGPYHRNTCSFCLFVVHLIPLPCGSYQVHTVQIKGKNRRIEMRPHPMFQVSAFCLVFLKGPYASKLLAGHALADEDKWRTTFRKFWANYRDVDPGCKVYTDHDSTLDTCIPVFLHGDACH